MSTTNQSSGLNDAQQQAVHHGPGPLLVVAGAGSGKTRVITQRIAHLVRQGVPPWQICALTFTNKAAREMRARVEALVDAPDLWVCTFHSFAARVLRRYADRLGYDNSYSIYDTEDKNTLLKEILKDERVDDFRPAEISNLISRRKNGLDADVFPDRRSELVTQISTVYNRRLRAANAMDFDDLLGNLLRLLQEDEDARERLRQRAHWLLVDEYQDTNRVQYSILRQLAEPARNVCATGDPDQSIYRWRGATIENILAFARDFPGAEIVTLDTNYRSTQAILDVANAVIRHNKDRYEKDLVTDNAGGKRVREIRCVSDDGEARAMAESAAQWAAGGGSLREVAVFYRVNAQSRLLERALAEAGVPYRIVGAVEFFRRREVKDVLAYVRLARNPADTAAFWRVFNVPARGLGKTTKERLARAAAQQGIAPRELIRDRDACGEFGRARRALLRLSDLLDAIEVLDPTDPGHFVEEVVKLTEYPAYLGEGTPGAESDRLENIAELVSAAAEYGLREPGGGVDGLVEEYALVSDQDAYDEGIEAVTLMTVHSAKGLEFDHVVVCGLEEELFPHAFSMESMEEVEEERRLFYVAATRARKELVLVHAGRRMRRGMVLPAMHSRFLDEIPDELLDVDDRTGGSGFGMGGFQGGAPGKQRAMWEDDSSLRESEPVFQLGGQRAGSASEPSCAFRSGDRVDHDHFGRGSVVAVRKAAGATRVTVDFDRAGRRELSLQYANLRQA